MKILGCETTISARQIATGHPAFNSLTAEENWCWESQSPLPLSVADKFLNRYRIPSTRLSTWDYSSNGGYFITICTARRWHYFGEIINAEMKLSTAGEFANECWLETPNHFPYFYLDVVSIMPNHVHGMS